ncbi:c6 finger domain protein [Diplodia corticola]|uniref:C6 finger domain protein n=1 Tax=Diplodia corticola TaxID=236234 RepID=A0A1J9S115_9PEZI|nr:c6 finger domain protein [Diplodia corticola]OJD38643.1 c6 finger domain protein [Diplodia corticola]
MADQSPNPPSRQPQQQQPAQQQPQPQQNSQPQQQVQQTPTSYPSPHSYPSPSMQPSYTYPPPQGAPGSAEPYRASPTASSMSLPSLNLPPIRAPIDGQQQQPGQPPAGSLPPPVAPMAYYPPPGHAPPQHHQMHMGAPMGMPPQSMGMRYQLPPQADQRIMSGGRHKKEIKRRTKTGCLTCRKRRIKCDEAHPTCRNCQKSKRECLGYDPIFKQQPGPPQIQPAPSAAPPVTSTPATAAPQPAQVPYSHVPQGYAPAAPNYAPGPGHSTSPPAPATDPSFELSAAIDPALAGTEPAPMSIAPVAYDPSTRVYVRKEGNGGSTPPPPEGRPLKAKRIYVDELFALQGVQPHAQPPTPGPIPPNVVEEIKMLFTRDYAISMDRCIETTWYTTKGLNRLLNDPATMDLFAFFVSQIRVTQDYEMQRRTTSLEAKLIWKLLCLPRQPTGFISNGANGTSEHETNLLQKEAALRVEVLEALLSYQVLPFNPLAELIYDPQVPHLKQYEVDFWRHLGTFVTFRDVDEESNRNIDATLSACRNILGMIECRDVIYSMMIARHYSGRFQDLPDNVSQQPYPPDQEDDRSKMVVAKKFLEDESQGRGMSQVIFRLAGMAIRSWSLGQ